MRADTKLGMRVFGIVVRSLAFVALYYAVMSSMALNVARWMAAFSALCFAVPFLLFDNKKTVMWSIIGCAAVYSALCTIVNLDGFCNGAAIFSDFAASAVNANMHAGWEYTGAVYDGLSDFLFNTVWAVWLALGTAALSRKSGLSCVVTSILILITIMILGLLPKFYALVPLVLAWVGLLVADRGFTLRSAGSCLVMTAALFAAIASSVIYNGSTAVKQFRADITDFTESVVYGSDTLPQGRLSTADGLHADSDNRLVVTMSARTPKLYLKGFVGSDLVNNAWQSTDKNKYVENGYGGLIDYLDEGGLPFMQYAKYSALCGNADKYNVSVNNVGANNKYMYVPYGLSGYSSGSPYYDLNMRNGALSSKSYDYTVFSGDGSSEWTVQDKWLLDSSLHTVAMKNYLARENEYRAFVRDTYCGIDDDDAAIIHERLFGIPTDSINTAARLLRTYFEENFELSDEPDKISGDFITDFFGGKIKKANAIYYATAATYAFRSFGFAARYVEGYLAEVPDEDGGVQTVTLTSKAAHAWTEVYFDGIGWLPIEVTFEVKDPNITVDPNDPENPDTPPEPIDPDKPDDPPPVTPDTPDINPNGGDSLTKSEKKLLIAQKIMLPILCVALFAVLIALGVLLRRCFVIGDKRRRLEARGSDFGRFAYGIVQHDCNHIGGYDSAKLKEYGISEASSARFMQLIEKSVYGGYDLNVNERKIVLRYIDAVASALSERGGKPNRFVCKYIRCVGI